jgi:signal recognition particle receptor subunit alpha
MALARYDMTLLIGIFLFELCSDPDSILQSTNLSKVCFWLLQNNYRVLIAACDTFRSGAVEQLRVHARNLKVLQSSNSVGEVELFERGYGKDAAGIAQDAISYGNVHDHSHEML